MPETRILFDCPIPAWAVGIAALALAAGLLPLLRRDLGALLPRWRRILLGLAFLAAIEVLGLVLSPKVVRTWTDPQKPALAVLVDGSRSMLQEDPADPDTLAFLAATQDPSDKPAAVAPNNPGNIARVELAHRLLTGRGGAWLAKIRQSFDVSTYRFAGTVQTLELDTPATSRPASTQPGDEALPSIIDPEGYVTALGSALDTVARGESGQGTSGQRPKAVVIITDGASNIGRDPVEVARLHGRLGIPVFAIGLGQADPPRDVAVLAIHAPAQCLLGDEVLVTAQVAATGYGALRIPVELLVDDQVVQRKLVTPPPSGRPMAVNFTLVPDAPGRQQIVVRVPPQEGERDTQNNQAEHRLDVIERKINVLLIDDEPRWEFRFLRNVLERDPAVETTVCLLRPGVGAAKGDGFLEKVPTLKQDLAPFDLVVLGDVGRERLPDAFLTQLADMVRNRGAGLIVIAGRRGHLRDLAGSPIASILPVTIAGMGDPSTATAADIFKPQLTLEGSTHLLTRLAATPEENEQIWAGLPDLHFAAGVTGLQRGAQSLLAHPYRLAGTDRLPLLAVQDVGSGKVMFSGIEETWRWRQSIGDRYHYRFWAQAIRWMVRKRFASGDNRARLSVDRTECDADESVQVEAYCQNADGFPLDGADVALRVMDDKGREQRLVMPAAPGGWGLYRATFQPAKPGKYHLATWVSTYGPTAIPSDLTLDVARVDLEKNSLSQDVATLQAVAQSSGGKYLRASQADQLPDLLAAKSLKRVITSEYSPCKHWSWYLALCLTLGAGWLIRKRSGLA